MAADPPMRLRRGVGPLAFGAPSWGLSSRSCHIHVDYRFLDTEYGRFAQFEYSANDQDGPLMRPNEGGTRC